jgi:hypothetical protein
MRLSTLSLLFVPSLTLALPTAQSSPRALTKTPGARIDQCVAHLGDCRVWDCCSGTKCLPNYPDGNESGKVSDLIDGRYEDLFANDDCDVGSPSLLIS